MRRHEGVPNSVQPVSSKLASEKVSIDDSSPESTARIRVEFDKEKLVKAEPESTILYLGNG